MSSVILTGALIMVHRFHRFSMVWAAYCVRLDALILIFFFHGGVCFQDNRWYRGLVSKTYRASNTALIFYVDYGNSEVVGLDR
jgi:hypothetical protein